MSLGRSGWLPPLKVIPKSLPPALPSAPTLPVAPTSIAPRGEVITHYDPSRVIDLDKLKVVEDLRAPEHAAERGETQTGDNGVMSPNEGGRIAPPVTGKRPGAGTAGLTPLQMGLLAVAGFLLLGG